MRTGSIREKERENFIYVCQSQEHHVVSLLVAQESSAKTLRKPLQQDSALTFNGTIMFVLSKHAPSFIPEVI